MSRYKPVTTPELPRFHGGAVGYFSYDVVRHVEDLPELGVDDLGLWDALFMITDSVLVFDNVNHKIKIIYNAYVPEAKNAKQEAYDEAVTKIENIVKKLRKPVKHYQNSAKQTTKRKSTPKLKSNFVPKDYKNAVKEDKGIH